VDADYAHSNSPLPLVRHLLPASTTTTPSEVGGAGAGPGNSFTLRVLEFNDVTDSFPSGPLGERPLKNFAYQH
jgi:hypothetical protein